MEGIPGTADRIAKLPKTWTIATTCTGCGTFELCLRAVADALSSALPFDADVFDAS